MRIAFALLWGLVSASPTTDYSCLHSGSWLVNKDSATSSYFSTTTDVTSSSLSSGVWSTTTNQIPKYNKLFSSSDISALNSRPKATTDFVSGSTTAVAGNNYQFGANIGYKTQSCSKGYWPPGPSCPSASSVTNSWDLTPSAETNSAGCYFPYLGKIGSWVNGVAIYGTSDGLSYNSQGKWYNLAAEFEVYDLDGRRTSFPLLRLTRLTFFFLSRPLLLDSVQWSCCQWSVSSSPLSCMSWRQIRRPWLESLGCLGMDARLVSDLWTLSSLWPIGGVLLEEERLLLFVCNWMF
jgi:hypothetical protein